MSYYHRRVGKRSKLIPQLLRDSSTRFIEYWRAIASGIVFLNVSLKKCLDVIHKDLVAIWNIRDVEEVCTREHLSYVNY